FGDSGRTKGRDRARVEDSPTLPQAWKADFYRCRFAPPSASTPTGISTPNPHEVLADPRQVLIVCGHASQWEKEGEASVLELRSSTPEHAEVFGLSRER